MLQLQRRVERAGRSSHGFGRAEPNLERLHKALDALHAINESLERARHRPEQVRRIRLAQGVRFHIRAPHRPVAREQPFAADAQRRAQRREKLHARRLALHVTPNRLVVGASELAQMAVCAITGDDPEPVVQSIRFHDLSLRENALIERQNEPDRVDSVLSLDAS